MPEERVAHLQHFRRRGWWTDFRDIRVRPDWEQFRRDKFVLQRALTDLPGLLCFKNPLLAWLGYHSPLAGFAHWLLYLVREPFYDYDKEKAKVRRKDG